MVPRPGAPVDVCSSPLAHPRRWSVGMPVRAFVPGLSPPFPGADRTLADRHLVDCTAVNTTASSPPGPGRRLVLLRHAETADNVAGRFLGRSDPSLTEAGMQAAVQLAAAFAQPSSADGALAVCSPARRAVETADHLGLRGAVIDDAFREIDFGSWEGFTQEEIAQRDPVAFSAFERGDIDGFPGGETVEAVRVRTVDALERHRSPRLVVVTHATVVRILVTALLGLPVSRYRSAFGRPANLSWTELEQTDLGWRLLTYDSRAVVHR